MGIEPAFAGISFGLLDVAYKTLLVYLKVVFLTNLTALQ